MTTQAPASTLRSDVLRHMADAMEWAEPRTVPTNAIYIGAGHACALGSLLLGLTRSYTKACALMNDAREAEAPIYDLLGVGPDDLMVQTPPTMAAHQAAYVPAVEALEYLYTCGHLERHECPAWLRTLADDAEREEAQP